MQEGSNTLWNELSGLADDYAELGRDFLQASRQLHMPGALPDEGLPGRIAVLRDRYQSLRDRVSALAEALGVPVPPLGTLKDLAVLMEGVTLAEEAAAERDARRRASLALLDRVLGLRHVQRDDFAPLVACHERARTLRGSIVDDGADELRETTEALAQNDHPFAYLLAMIDGVDELTDDLWESLFEAVGREFGPSLAAAVARSKVVPVEETQPSAAVVVGSEEAEPLRSVTLRADAPEGHAPTAMPTAPSAEGMPSQETGRAIGSALAALTSDDLLNPVVEEAMPFLPRGIAAILAARSRGVSRKRSMPRVERLETVRLMSCNVIAGHVFNDANNNGLFDSGESPIANSVIQLRNAAGVVVGSVTTDSGGAYTFDNDATIDTTPRTVSQSITIPDTPTNFSRPFSLGQFDPALGDLLDVQITVNGAISSLIRAENTSRSSGETITARITGDILLTGPGLNFTASLNDTGGTFNAGVYDGVIDYAGPSGHDFGTKTASVDETRTLSKQAGDDLAAFIGTGQFNGTFDARARSSAEGGGNLDYETISSAQAIITVVYRYTPNNCLAPGNYTIVQLDQPPGTLNGKRSTEGQVLNPPTTGPDTIPVTLTDRDLIRNDFGEIIPSSLSGFVYADANNDGVKQSGEAPIPGTTVTLTGTNDLGQPVSLTATTDSNGAYGFTNLRPGTYQIVETQPAGYLDGKDTIGSQGGTTSNDQFSNIVLGQGTNGVNNNFGELGNASISGFVYVDASNDGVKDPGEAPIAGVTVALTGTDDLGRPVSLTTSTDSNGAYAFTNLRPGTYQIVETQPSAYLDGKDSVGSQGGTLSNDRISAITLSQGQSGVNNNFGELQPASLSGFVYFDRDNDGVKAGSETGIPSTTVTLTGTDDLGQPVSLTAATDSNGAYSFTNLRPGTYRLVETQPAGYLDGKDTIGSQGGTAGNDQLSDIVLGQGVNGVNNNFGELTNASISGFVYVDASNDGVKDAGEAPIAGVTVALTGTDDLGQPVSLTTSTDANGAYSFTNLRPGTYQIVETQPSAYLDGKDAVGSQGGTLSDDRISAITLNQGDNGVNNNFGELIPASLAGFVYFDRNNDGVKAVSETGIPGTTVTLTGTDDLGQPVSLTATTDGNGAYSFNNLRPGTYRLVETQPSGYLDGKDTIGTPGGTTGNDQFSDIVLGQGVNGVNNNFGELTTASISGFVYVDASNDGVKDAGETPITGVTVTLTGTDDLGQPVSLTTSTDANGAYSLTNLRPGTYQIVETQPTAYLDGKDAVGSQGGTLSNDQISAIALNQGDNGVNNNFGELIPANLSGFVYFDRNNDGLKDASETGIPGTTVTLTGTNDLGQPVSLTATTDGNGAYAFTNLRPGTYRLVETQPSGYLDGKDTIGSQGGTAGNDQFSDIVLGQGQSGVNNNFGELTNASISGFVYVDASNDGVKDAGEAPIAGVTVALTGTDDLGQAVSLSTTTDANGAYSFTNLRPGTYQIAETQPSAYLDGKDAVGSQGGTLSDDRISAITLNQGDNGVNNNFGELLPASIAGFVYYDQDDNGVKAAGETGIPGTAVTLTGTDDLGQSVNLTTTTDANGAFLFPNLRPGTYRLVETQPSGYLDGKDAVGSQGGTLSNDQIDAIALGQGTNGVNNNFGELLPGGLSGFVYADANRNGLKDAGEVGLPNVPIRLTGIDSQGAVAEQFTLTDANGFYSFTNLRPGTYVVTETQQPAGYIDGLESRGNVTPLNGTRTSDTIDAIGVVAGTITPNNNFGEEVEETTPGANPPPPGTPDCTVIAQVDDVIRRGIHHQPTRIVLTFNADIDPASASNVANYHLVFISRAGEVSRREIPLRSAVYDANTRTVTLTTAYPLNIHYHHQLTVSGVKDLCGDPIDGDRDGRSGGNFVTVLTKANYREGLTQRAIQAEKVAFWADRFPRLAAQRLTTLRSPRRRS